MKAKSVYEKGKGSNHINRRKAYLLVLIIKEGISGGADKLSHSLAVHSGAKECL